MMTELMNNFSLTTHSSQSAAIAIGNGTFKGDDFPMFETRVTNYFKTHNIYHLLEKESSGPSSRVSMGGTVREVDEDVRTVDEIEADSDAYMSETVLEMYFGNEEEKEGERIAREARNRKTEASNVIIVKNNAIIANNNAILAKKRARIANMNKKSTVCFAAYTYIFTALTVDTAKMFLHVVPGNVYALWKAIKTKYKGVTLVSESHIQDMLASTCLGINDDIDVYVAKINGYQLQLIDLESGMTEKQLIYRLCKGLPESYDNLLEIIRQTSKSHGNTLSFDDIVTRLREYQILQRNKTVRNEAHAAFERAYVHYTNAGGNTPSNIPSFTPQNNQSNNNAQKHVFPPHQQTTSYQMICFRCEGNHSAKKCKIDEKTIKCDTCKETGHLTSQHDRFSAIRERLKSKFKKAYVHGHGHFCSRVVVSDVVVPSPVVNSVVVSDSDGLLNDNDADLALYTNAVKHYVLDSGASQHFTNDISTMKNVNSINPIHLQTAGKNVLTGNQCGTNYIDYGKQGVIGFDNTVYVPDLSTNLLSVSQMTASGRIVIFINNEAIIVKPDGHRKLVIPSGDIISVPKIGKLYVVKEEQNYTDAHVITSQYQHHNNAFLTATQLAHERLGHLSASGMKKLIKSGGSEHLGIDIKQFNLDEIKNCDGCLQGKLNRQSFNGNYISHVQGILDRVHSDVCGKINGQYFITFIDEYSGKVWAPIINNKSDCEMVIKQWINEQETSTGKKLKSFHSDNGGEYVSESLTLWFKTKGIMYTHSPARTPERNGKAECMNRVLLNIVRSMMIAAKLPSNSILWTYALSQAIYIRNRCNTAALTGVNLDKVPEEVWTGVKPSMKHIKVFGCDVYTHIDDTLRDGKLSSKADKGIHLGFDQLKHAYYIYNTNTHKMTTQHSVTFIEHCFAHVALIDHTSVIMSGIINDCIVEINDLLKDLGDITDDNELELVKRISLEEYKRENGHESKTQNHTHHVINAYNSINQIPQSHIDHNEQKYPHIDVTHIDLSNKQIVNTNVPQNTESNTTQTSTIATPNINTSTTQSHSIGPIATRSSGRISRKVNRYGMVDESDIGQLCYENENECITNDVSDLYDDNSALIITNGVDLVNADDPKNYTEAMESVGAIHWSNACDAEYNGFIMNNTWELVPLPTGCHAVGTQWVFTTKLNQNGEVEKYKARAVVRGDQQRAGNDYDSNNIYAPVVGMITLRILLSIVCILNYELFQMDVTQAFLHALIKEVIYVKQLQGYDDGTGRVCRLNKAMYGTKQAPYEWNDVLHKFMIDNGWKCIWSDPCLYIRISSHGLFMYLAIYVDDLIAAIATMDVIEWNEFKVLFMNRFTTKDLGEAKWILKMEIKRDRKARTLFLSQSLYIQKLVQLYDLDSEDKLVHSPEPNHIKLRDSQCPIYGSNEHTQMQNIPYREIVGALLYATATRFDIAHAVNMLARYLNNPGMKQWEVAKNVVRYLKCTSNHGLLYSGFDQDGVTIKSIDMKAYSDADWAGNLDTFKSTSGGLVYVGGNLIDGYTRSQHTVSLSSTESELIAVTEVVKSVKWVKNVLSELGFVQSIPTPIYCDNESTIRSTLNKGLVTKLKHMNLRYKWIKDEVKFATIKLFYVASQQNLADILTKALTPKPFKHLRDQLVFMYSK